MAELAARRSALRAPLDAGVVAAGGPPRPGWGGGVPPGVRPGAGRTTSRTRTVLFGRPRRTTRTVPRGPLSTRARWPVMATVTRRTCARRTCRRWMRIERRLAHVRDARRGAGMRAAAPGHDALPTASVARWSMSRDERPTMTP